MNYEDLIASIMACVILLTIIVLGIYIMVRYGFKQIELDMKCREEQIRFYKNASKLIEKDLNGDENVKQ